jgi:triosephosphate isomerase
MKSLIVANWKMNPTSLKDAQKLLDATVAIAQANSVISIIVAPPSIFLASLRAQYRGKRIAFAMQSARQELAGSFTGDISLTQAQDAGAAYVIVGHAERRARGETNDDTREKVSASLALGLTPILCIGETVRNSEGAHFSFIRDQIRAGFADVPTTKIPRVIVAYEPVWAIGGDTAMSPTDMHEVAIFIRKTIVDLYGAKGMKVQILYGGAVDENNALPMMQGGDIDGLLIGRASLDKTTLLSLVRSLK